MVIAILLAMAAAQPSPEALRLGRQLAESGTLAALLPLMQKSETDELVNQHHELSAAEKEQLRDTASRVYQQGHDRIMEAEARSYASQLSIADMRRIAAFQRSTAGQHMRAAMPKVIAGTMQNVGKLDFKADVTAVYCTQTGKLCAK